MCHLRRSTRNVHFCHVARFRAALSRVRLCSDVAAAPFGTNIESTSLCRWRSAIVLAREKVGTLAVVICTEDDEAVLDEDQGGDAPNDQGRRADLRCASMFSVQDDQHRQHATKILLHGCWCRTLKTSSDVI